MSEKIVITLAAIPEEHLAETSERNLRMISMSSSTRNFLRNPIRNFLRNLRISGGILYKMLSELE